MAIAPSDGLDHRRGAVDLTVALPDGSPAADALLTIEQTRHAFGFGNIGFDFVGLANSETSESTSAFGGASAETAARLADLWLAVYNTVTLPFYWRGFEPTEGAPDTERLLAAVQWFAERGVTIKGHPLLWHTLAPEWLMPHARAERYATLERVIHDRIVRETHDFAGVIDLWDALNEPVILPVFEAEDNAVTRLAQARSRVEVIRLAFESAREGNPHARLVLNDFDLSPAYEAVIEECLEAGIEIDALGLQTHMHQGYRGEDEVHAILERFARFGLPLQLTETTLVSGDLMPPHIVDLNDYQVDHWPSTPEGEERQADELVRHHRVAFAHPAVESVVYWGLTDEGSWLGAPAGLVRADGSPKPAYEAFRALVKDEWWTAPYEARADAHGSVRVAGWAGSYRVTCADQTFDVEVPAGATDALAVTLP